ncbi:hypothetical protein Amme_076_007 [Acidomonas methanolica NBRC 104435]|uniref:Uncharacterized protein n=1 Tax=Acidomonas methanolica NBRC 104435 TaxID=1231351 RepID=A0A023D6L4_ACIMT|nr:hypothetical protein EDC31_12553 [Acidomonas methanolica]GAJ29714.1 hypothetical protein Amme_076_007 [Acidomonas methanolica NBRC 104435]
MPWFRLTGGFCGIGHDAGPPPSVRLLVLRVSWWRGELPVLIEKMRAALAEAKREILR